MIVSYDMDGVLAEKPPASDKKWGHMCKAERNQRQLQLLHWYRSAATLLTPIESYFYVVSARKAVPAVHNITAEWLNIHYGNRILGLGLLHASRTIKNVVTHKCAFITANNISRHYEDNKKVLAGIRSELGNAIELYFWEAGMQSAVPF